MRGENNAWIYRERDRKRADYTQSITKVKDTLERNEKFKVLNISHEGVSTDGQWRY